MATLIWLGATTDSRTLSNWKDQSTGLAPTAIATTDDFVFDTEGAANNCDLYQSTFATLTTSTGYSGIITFQLATHNLDALNLLHETEFQFAQVATSFVFSGNHATTTPFFNHPVVFGGEMTYGGSNGRETVIFDLSNNNSDPAYLCDGQYPVVKISDDFTTDVSSDVTNSNFTKVECIALKMQSDGAFVNANIDADDSQKHIEITAEDYTTVHLTVDNSTFDTSNAKLTIAAQNSQYLPATSDTTNFGGSNTTFYANLGDVVISKGSAFGNKVFIADGLTVECESIEIQNGAFLLGGEEPNAASEIHSVKKPKIRGTWNFKPITDGIYRSFGRTSSSVFELTSQTAHITDKLTVDGLIDPTGMEFTPVSSNPGGVAANTIWVNSGDNNRLYFGSSHISGGGGGGGTVDVVSNVATNTILGRNDAGSGDSEELTPAEVRTMLNVADGATANAGTVTSVATTAPITGGPITSTGTIGISAATTSAAGSMSAADKTKLDGIETGADVTDATNVQAAGALMDSEVTNLADVKAFDPAAYATAAQGSLADTALQSFTEADPIFGASEAALFVAGDKAKLDAIEAAADVTDTANVTAAGALMDSEVTNLADVKSFDPADYRPATSETCLVRLSTSVSSFTPTAAYTLLQKTGNWDASPANSNFDDTTGLYTVPSDGVYRVTWGVSFRYTASGQTQASRIYVNGSWTAQGQVNTTGNWPLYGGSILLDLSANDTIGMYVYISATGKNLVGDSVSKAATHMSIEKVSN